MVQDGEFHSIRHTRICLERLRDTLLDISVRIRANYLRDTGQRPYYNCSSLKTWYFASGPLKRLDYVAEGNLTTIHGSPEGQATVWYTEVSK
jgi:hypothetical protein